MCMNVCREFNMDFKNEERDFINEHLLAIEDIPANILEMMDEGEGIIITTENGKIIDIEAVWSEDDKYEDCWNVKIYESYEEYSKCGNNYFLDSVSMKDFTVNHIKSYME